MVKVIIFVEKSTKL
jgi:hypothetical protein